MTTVNSSDPVFIVFQFLNQEGIQALVQIIGIIAILLGLINHLIKTLLSLGIKFPIKYLNILSYFIFGLLVVVLSATFGPYTIEHFANYTISGPRTMTASDATNYTVQALVASVIVGFLSSLKDKS